MTLDEVSQLDNFTTSERDAYGKQVQWENYDKETMIIIDQFRSYLGQLIQQVDSKLRASIFLIRGGVEHDPIKFSKMTAVDFVSRAPFKYVMMSLMRLPLPVSWGVYEGCSVHFDRRSFPVYPARWFAFRNNLDRVNDLREKGFKSSLYNASGSWLYCNWNHPQAWNALQYLLILNGPYRI